MSLFRCKQQAARSKPRQHLPDFAPLYRKAAKASSHTSGLQRHIPVDILRAVNHNRSLEGKIVLRIQADQPPRTTMLSDIGVRDEEAPPR